MGIHLAAIEAQGNDMLEKISVFGNALLILVPFLAGCGPAAKIRESNRQPASGIVIFDGKPLGGGTVTFVSVKDSMYGPIDRHDSRRRPFFGD